MLEEIDIHDGLIDEWYEIAAYTPENWRVTHTDEIVQRVRFDRPFSLVGITANTAAAPHATGCTISCRFARQGIPRIIAIFSRSRTLE